MHFTPKGLFFVACLNLGPGLSRAMTKGRRAEQQTLQDIENGKYTPTPVYRWEASHSVMVIIKVVQQIVYPQNIFNDVFDWLLKLRGKREESNETFSGHFLVSNLSFQANKNAFGVLECLNEINELFCVSRESTRPLGTVRTKMPSILPQISKQSPSPAGCQSPESPPAGSRNAAEDLRRSLEDGRNMLGQRSQSRRGVFCKWLVLMWTECEHHRELRMHVV